MTHLHVKYWARLIPWHNWVFAGYYLFFGFMGLNALLFPPVSIDGASGPWITAAWGASSVACAAIGIYGALRPNFRFEVAAAWFGIIAVFAYASTVQIIILVQQQPTRAGQFWAIAAHVWPFILRLMYVRLRTKQIEADRLEDRRTGLGEI